MKRYDVEGDDGWMKEHEAGSYYEVDDADARIGVLEKALRDLLQYLDDHDWGSIPEGETADRARNAIAKSELT